MFSPNTFSAPARRVFFLVDHSGKAAAEGVNPSRWLKVASRGCCAACKVRDREISSFLRYRSVWLRKSGVRPVLIDPVPDEPFVQALRAQYDIDPGPVDFSLRELGLQCLDELIVARPRKEPRPVSGRARRIADDYELEVVRFGCPSCMPRDGARPDRGQEDDLIAQLLGGRERTSPGTPMARIVIEIPAGALLAMVIGLLLRNAMSQGGDGPFDVNPDEFGSGPSGGSWM